MKKFLLLLPLLGACGGFSGFEKGTFSGRLVDASEEGIFNTSCELEFIKGEQGSATSQCAMKGKCGETSSKVGEILKVNYSSRILDFTIISSYLCELE